MGGVGKCRIPSEEFIADDSVHALAEGGSEVSRCLSRPHCLLLHRVVLLLLPPRFDLVLLLDDVFSSLLLVFEDGELQFPLTKGAGSITLGEGGPATATPRPHDPRHIGSPAEGRRFIA